MGFEPREFRPLKSIWKKGFLYLGQWRIGTNIIEGRAVIIYRDGTLYEGYVKDNQITGYGRLIYQDSQAYLGEFKARLYHGFGVKRDFVT